MTSLPMFNITYADRYDTIYYISNGKMPRRNADTSFNWKSTVPGNTSKTLWTEFKTVNELPQYINPPSGYLFNTNHSPFLTYDIYDPQQGKFLDTRLAQTILTRIGFAVTPIVYEGKFPTEEHLDLLLNGDTIFSTKAKREGLYIKVSDGQWITHRFKMVRPGFVPGALFLKDDFLRNTLI
jgi:hypothetical protein